MANSLSKQLKSKNRIQKEYFCIFVLLICSGNNLVNKIGAVYSGIGLLLVLFTTNFGVFRSTAFVNFLVKISLALGLIFLAQNFFLGFVSWIGVVNFLIKLTLGGICIFYLKKDFEHVLFNSLYWLCLISLFGYLIINVLGAVFPSVELLPGKFSYVLYSTTEQHFYQNQSMFWEPGAFAGIITLVLILNFERLDILYKFQRSKLFVVLAALLTTQSTTGYIAFFTLMTLFVLSKMKIGQALLALAVFASVSLIVYNSVDFLSSKISAQYQESKELDEGEFSNSRFGSLLFDWYYIEKHPIIGNGLHERTRYADNPELIQTIEEGENLGNGNGFSNFIASMGIPCMIIYFVLVYKGLRKKSHMCAIAGVVCILINLQGEPWLNYPIYLGLPFFYLLKPDSIIASAKGGKRFDILTKKPKISF